eukprot:7388178-Prymnesium_polylepis.1
MWQSASPAAGCDGGVAVAFAERERGAERVVDCMASARDRALMVSAGDWVGAGIAGRAGRAGRAGPTARAAAFQPAGAPGPTAKRKRDAAPSL